jgi:hypothetical protein
MRSHSLARDGRRWARFLRCDRGPIPSDHHPPFLVGSGQPKLNHAAFEVANLNDLTCGNDWLRAKERHHEWAIGHHLLGSQSFEYWRDPRDHLIEHFTDGDLLEAARGSRMATVQELMSWQWGPPASPTMG